MARLLLCGHYVRSVFLSLFILHSLLYTPILTILGYEWKDGVIKPLDEQHPSYKSICNTPDPDGDGEDECIGGLPPAPE